MKKEKNMSGMIKIKLWVTFIITGMLGIGSLFYCTCAYCEDRTVHTNLMGERPLYPGYPLIFDVRGQINRLSKGEIVIDDSLFKLSDDVEIV